MKKLRQITDNMRGTIYLSELEYRMMSTPFFNRLNDVYQCSTVYMTYPSNRTKRYEHSLGTMELASQMFCASIQNASSKDRQVFFENIEKTFNIIIDRIAKREKLSKVFYVDRGVSDKLNNLMPKKYCVKKETYDAISKTMTAGAIRDMALAHNAICFNDISLVDEQLSQEKVSLYSYLYQCCLEAVRISALFHDAGHPPYSHIVEEVLCELYNNLKNDCKDYDSEKVNNFINSLKPFLENPQLPQLLLGNENVYIDNALHEQIGIKVLMSTFYGIILELLDKIEIEHKKSKKMRFSSTLYYITVIEFTFSILLEKTPEMKSIHGMISGGIDADRLDYIMRDSVNSGVNWGKIPYKRIVESAKLINNNKRFCFAFPQKTSEDIDDLLVTRYKIFNRINFHHRTEKTAAVLQNVIQLLVLDYLKSSNNKLVICEEIADLWNSLKDVVGLTATEKSIGRWNDSWLISVFNNALITLSDSGSKMFDEDEDEEDDDDERRLSIEHIKNMLEEVLLNKKYYYSMIKRKSDIDDLMKAVVDNINMEDCLEKIKVKEYSKLTKEGAKKQILDEAGEALRRVHKIEQIIEEADFEMLETIMSLESHYDEVIENVLKDARQGGEICDYIIKRNLGRNKYGIDILLPDDNNNNNTIYLYGDGKCHAYNVGISLTKQLMALRIAYPWIFVYIKPNKGEEIQTIMLTLKGKIAKGLGNEIIAKMEELFNIEFGR